MANLASPLVPSKAPPTGEEPDDYMTMTIPEPVQNKQKETYTQRRIRKQREAEKKSRPLAPSASLETALSTSLPSSSKGFQMLSKLGYKPGSTLGAAGNKSGALEPLMLDMKDGREGVGMANEKKRKFREEVESRERIEREEQIGYRDRIAKEKEDRRVDAMVIGAMKVAERLEEENRGNERHEENQNTKEAEKVNVLYRSLVRQRNEQERERRARYDFTQSLSRHATYIGDAEDHRQDALAWGREEVELEESTDEELEAFEALESKKKLVRLVAYLREKFWYCFWCKCRYEDEKMEGCPGVTEDDHD